MPGLGMVSCEGAPRGVRAASSTGPRSVRRSAGGILPPARRLLRRWPGPVETRLAGGGPTMNVPCTCRVGHPGGAPIFSTCYGREGAWLAAGDGVGDVIIWGAADDEPVSRRTIHDRAVRALTVASDGASLVTGSTDGTARLWPDWPDGEPRVFYRGVVWSLADQ